MNGTMDWSALEVISEYLDIDNVELFIDGLVLLKNYADAQPGS